MYGGWNVCTNEGGRKGGRGKGHVSNKGEWVSEWGG